MKEAKKILIITYYWPPAGGPGVQRWLKFTKYLPEFSWKPTVFIPENPSYPIIDDTLAKEVSPQLDIIKTKIWEPYQIAEKFGKDNKKFKAGQFDVGKNQSWRSKLSIWVRGNFFIPDARVFWVKPSLKFLKQYLKENQFDAFVTTGPPHSLHLIGLGLKKEFPDLKWIADFRDPWTEISYYKHLKLTKSSDKKHQDLEQKVFDKADITLATSYTDAENFRKKGANAVCITNGFDEEIQDPRAANLNQKLESAISKPETQNSRTTKFTLSYIGVLEQLRNPEVLWEVLNEIITQNSDFKSYFKLNFVGRVDDKILEKINLSPLKNVVNNVGYLSHSESITEMRKANLLLLTNFPEESSKGIIPGKIFEYLSTGNPILSFGPESSDVERILDQTKAGKHFTCQQKSEVKQFILNSFQQWKTGNLKTETAGIEEFSRKNLTKKLAEILESR